jgi:hypothetical protein
MKEVGASRMYTKPSIPSLGFLIYFALPISCTILSGCGESEKDLKFFESCTKIVQSSDDQKKTTCSCLHDAATEIEDQDSMQAITNSMSAADPTIDPYRDKTFADKMRSLAKADRTKADKLDVDRQKYMKKAVSCFGQG